jgi:hypothetical protein
MKSVAEQLNCAPFIESPNYKTCEMDEMKDDLDDYIKGNNSMAYNA